MKIKYELHLRSFVENFIRMDFLLLLANKSQLKNISTHQINNVLYNFHYDLQIIFSKLIQLSNMKTLTLSLTLQRNRA